MKLTTALFFRPFPRTHRGTQRFPKRHRQLVLDALTVLGVSTAYTATLAVLLLAALAGPLG